MPLKGYCIAISRRVAKGKNVVSILILIMIIITTYISNPSIRQNPLLGVRPRNANPLVNITLTDMTSTIRSRNNRNFTDVTPLKILDPVSFKMNSRDVIKSDISSVQSERLNHLTSRPTTTTVRDNFPWTYLINEPQFCQDRGNLFIINILGTVPSNVERRNHIRNMWGNKDYLNQTGFATVFLIASVFEKNMLDKVKEESLAHRDILLMDFQESYDNLTLKTLTILHWTSTYCTSPQWVLKSDTDVFINPFSLSKHLRHIDRHSDNTTGKLLCRAVGPKFVCREDCIFKKWIVSFEEYPNDMYPRYCLGPAYIIPRKLVWPIYKQANKTHPFRMEDVYYTGILPIEMGIGEIIDNLNKNDTYPWDPKKWSKTFMTNSILIMGLEYRFGENATLYLWNHVLKHLGKISKIPKTIDELYSIEW